MPTRETSTKSLAGWSMVMLRYSLALPGVVCAILVLCGVLSGCCDVPGPTRTIDALTPADLSGERIQNGSFEQGLAGFQSEYLQAGGKVLDELTYAVVRDPTSAHPDAKGFADHTTGSGRFLIVNGGNASDRALWSQSVPVGPGTHYVFTLWATSWYPSNPAELAVIINGASIGKIAVSTDVGIWKEFRGDWNAGDSKRADIRIINTRTEFSGNDFAIDDVSMRATVPPATRTAR